jgi:hypothetical protein
MNRRQLYYQNNKAKEASNRDLWRQANPEKREAEKAKARESMRAKLSDPSLRAAHNEQCRLRYHARKHQFAESYMLQAARKRAKERGLDYDLSEADIIIPDTCPILGISLIKSDGRKSANSPSLDRIDPRKGYVKGNVQVISMKANMMKSDASREELIAFATWVLSQASMDRTSGGKEMSVPVLDLHYSPTTGLSVMYEHQGKKWMAKLVVCHEFLAGDGTTYGKPVLAIDTATAKEINNEL